MSTSSTPSSCPSLIGSDLLYPPERCIHQWFEAQVKRTPEAKALIFEHQSLSYIQLNQRANQVAHALKKLGVGPEVIVGLYVEKNLELMIGLLGILKAGGAYLPMDVVYPSERLAFMLEDARPLVLLTQTSLLTKLPNLKNYNIKCLDLHGTFFVDESTENLETNVTPDNLAYIIYTSGSTGQPKGVCVTHYNVVRLFQATHVWFGFNEQDVWSLFHSYAFDFSVWEMWGALFYGGCLVIVPYAISRTPKKFYELLCSQGVTVLNQTPSAFQQLIQVEEAYGSSKLHLRLIIFGGEALNFQSLAPWFERHGDQRPQLVNMYGITETTVHSSYRPLTKADLNSPGSMIGCPLPDLQFYLLDESLQLVPMDVLGEIYIGGAGVARGYLNRPELTQKRFITNPFKPGDILYKSGDGAYFRAHGEFEYLGRLDQQVKIRGYRVELGEIETLLRQDSSVRDVTVIVREDSPRNPRLVAYVVSQWVPERLPIHKACIVQWDDHPPIALRTEDISCKGVGLIDVPETCQVGQTICLYLQWPEMVEKEMWLEGKVVWYQDRRAGIELDSSLGQKFLCHTMDYLLETEGVKKIFKRTLTSHLRNVLKERLPSYMIPSNFVFLSTLPLTPNGKIDRQALASLEPIRPKIKSFPHTPTEEIVATLWAEVLQLNQVGLHENFIELGGHSLLSAQILSKIQQIFHLELPLHSLFKWPTVSQLAKQIDAIHEHKRVVSILPMTSIEDALVPLSFPQQQMWLLAQLLPQVPVYNEPFTIRLGGPIQIELLEQSFNEMISRHESLRTIFITVEEQVRQKIVPYSPFQLPVVDFRHLPLQERETMALGLATQEAKQAFDLTEYPLFRATLVQLDDTDYRLFLVFHHIIIDGVSIYNIFLPELEALYKAFTQKQASPLPPLSLQYKEFAHWQRQSLQGDFLKPLFAYWTKKLANLPTLSLPTDYPPPLHSTARGARVCLNLSTELTQALKALSRREGVTLFVTLLAAFKTLLYRYTDQDDIVIGTVTSGRYRAEFENIMGNFLNTLVLRTQMSDTLSFHHLLKQVRETTIEAYAHQELPFEKLVEELRPTRTVHANPLFQVGFVLETPHPTLELGWTLSQLDVHPQSAKFDLTMELDERTDGIIGRIEYNTDLFTQETINRMVGHFKSLLQGIVVEPKQRLSDLPLLTMQEEQQLWEWGHPPAQII